MTYDDYLAEVRAQLRANPEWRVGQTFWNVLQEVRADLASLIHGSDLDPFYRDGRLAAFHEFVVEKW